MPATGRIVRELEAKVEQLEAELKTQKEISGIFEKGAYENAGEASKLEADNKRYVTALDWIQMQSFPGSAIYEVAKDRGKNVKPTENK